MLVFILEVKVSYVGVLVNIMVNIINDIVDDSDCVIFFKESYYWSE